ncbi:MAG: hypothetical protein HYV32_02320 [Candidatus Kerfeldbacteria bacterium]|nr:hypothetical protein [Candidatus Kerfeldbacteria bacterium]
MPARSGKKTSTPQPTVTPKQQRKFALLVSLACLILILFWIATLPFNLTTPRNGTPGAKQLFHNIGSLFGTGFHSLSTIID